MASKPPKKYGVEAPVRPKDIPKGSGKKMPKKK